MRCKEMQYRIIATGRTREPHFAAAAGEYLKRLGPYARAQIIEVPDRPVPEKGGEAARAEVRRQEGSAILRQVPSGWTLVALDPGGRQMSSEELAGWLRQQGLAGRSSLAFVLGGTLGLSGEVLAAASLRLSLSAMTFPHQLALVVLLEQLYRAARISAGEPYHW